MADLDHLGVHEVDHLPLVVLPVDGHAEKRIAHGILVREVEIEVVAFVGNLFAGKSDYARAVIAFDGGFLPFDAPAALY